MGWVDALTGKVIGVDTAPLIYFIEQHPAYLGREVQPTTNDHPAVKVLQAFFSEKDSWESEVARHYKSIPWGNVSQDELERAQASQRKQLEGVYERYCEVGKEAERLQDLGLSFDPDGPEHEDEAILSVNEHRGKILIETKSQRQGFVFLYELVQVEDGWRVRDSRKRRFQDRTKWSRDML